LRKAIDMASKRMFSCDIIDRDNFYDLPFNSQLLYFHLGMKADVKGFIEPKKIIRTVGLKIEDLRPLVTEGFVIPFESGVVVITHWNVHNNVRETHEAPTQFVQESEGLLLSEEGVYRLQENYSSTTVELPQRLDEVRLDKIREGESKKEVKPLASLSYLINIPEDDISEFTKFFECSPKDVRIKAEGLHDYCKSKGKTYKDYKALLRGALRRDFGVREVRPKFNKFGMPIGE